MRRKRIRVRQRRGAAIVEFAVCLPVIMILILGSIEATSAIFLKQALTTAAYEGIREAIKRGPTPADAMARASNTLTQRRVRGSTITFSPANTDRLSRGTIVSVEVTAALGTNSPFIGKVIPDRTITVRSVMVKE